MSDEARVRLTAKSTAGFAFLRALNEWRDAGGSDIALLLALDAYLCEAIKAGWHAEPPENVS